MIKNDTLWTISWLVVEATHRPVDFEIIVFIQNILFIFIKYIYHHYWSFIPILPFCF